MRDEGGGLYLVAIVTVCFVVWVLAAAWAFSRIFANDEQPPESESDDES